MREREGAAVETTRRVVSKAADNDRRSLLYRDRFRIQSTRLPNWDYAGNGAYFVTICTRDRAPVLGQTIDGRILLSPVGQIVEEEWRRTETVRQYVAVDQFVVMPNHLHGILMISGRHPAMRETDAVETTRRVVSTASRPTLTAGSLGAIVGQFKSVCTKRARAAGLEPVAWQPRFFEHIIRDDDELNRVRQYVLDNPLKWQDEADTPANLWI